LNVGEQHEIIPLRKFTDDLRDKLRTLSLSINDKIKRCRSSVKSTWKRLSDLEDHVESINHTIDIMADDLVMYFSIFVERIHRTSTNERFTFYSTHGYQWDKYLMFKWEGRHNSRWFILTSSSRQATGFLINESDIYSWLSCHLNTGNSPDC
jgi:hypothetical protein